MEYQPHSGRQVFVPVAPILQREYAFKDTAFETYLGMESAQELTPDNLINLSSEMTTDAHPLIAYSAGWATAEAALYRGKREDPPNIPAEQRIEWLNQSADYWQTAKEGLFDIQHHTPDVLHRAYFSSMRLRSAVALGSLSALKMISRWISGETPAPKSVVAAAQETHENMLEIAAALVRANKKSNWQRAQQRAGVRNELTTNLLIQGKEPDANGLLVPTSFRQCIALRNMGMRSDLVAVPSPSIGTKKRTFIRVISQAKEQPQKYGPSSAAVLVVNAQEDLLLDKVGSAAQTLDAILRHEKHNDTWPPDLQSASTKLQDRVLAQRYS